MIGNLKDVQTVISNGEMQKMLSGLLIDSPHKDTNQPAISLGVLDRALEGFETVLHYFNPLGWVKWGKKKSSKDAGTEFDVVHTNWYWRNQRRKLRFSDKGFMRLHPVHNDVRSAHSYEEVEVVEAKSPTCLVFKYKSTSTDWISCSEKDLPAIVSILRAKSVIVNAL